MAIPSINDFITYINTKLTGTNWNSNLQKIVDWFTDGNTDMSIKSLVTTGDITATGDISAVDISASGNLYTTTLAASSSGLIAGKIFTSGFFAPIYLGRELLYINSPASGSTHTFDVDLAYIPSGSSDYVYQRFIKIFIKTAVGGSGDHQMDEYDFCITSLSQTLELIKTNNYFSTSRFSLAYTSSSGPPFYKRTLTVTILTSEVDSLQVSIVVFQ